MDVNRTIGSCIVAFGLLLNSILSAHADPYTFSTIDVPSTPATGTVTGTLAFNVTNPLAGDNRTPYVIGVWRLIIRIEVGAFRGIVLRQRSRYDGTGDNLFMFLCCEKVRSGLLEGLASESCRFLQSCRRSLTSLAP